MKIYNKLESLEFFEWLSETHNLVDTDMESEYLDKLPLNDMHRTVCNSMVFRWFREKYKIQSLIQEYLLNTYMYTIDDGINSDISVVGFETYEEAESACIDKLIELVKNK